jgi:predicted nuclease of predicted toxin-antitoxin system
MKILLDQNISYRVVKTLQTHFSLIEGVKQNGLINKSDFEIWDFAKHNSFAIVTNDEDFSILATYYGAPPKIVWIRRGNLSNAEFVDLLIMFKETINNFIDSADVSKSILEIY